MKKKHFLSSLGLLFLVFISSTYGQDAVPDTTSILEGYWSGVLTQEEGGFTPDYIFQMYLEIDGEKVKGTAIVSTSDTLTATMEFEGNVYNGEYLNLEETKLMEGTKMSTYEWCLKQYSLFLRKKEDTFYLVGYWTGRSKSSTCIPGKIKLKKRADRV